MNTEKEITAAIEAAQKNYHDKAETLSASEANKLTDEITLLKKGLSDHITDGAEPCPSCKEQPFGMKRGRGMYEIGCRTCTPVKTEAGIVLFSAQGETAADAVENWNAQNFRVKP
jgi:hypothetical protein